MNTAEYPYFQPPFDQFNVVQSAVVPFLDKDMNLVVSFATAVGKTVLAECAFGYHLSEQPGSRVAYVCPYRSLAEEKWRQWLDDQQFAKHGVLLCSGESPATPEEFSEARVAVLTSESFDSKSRNKRYREWLKSLTCVAFDEAHTLGADRRGAALESAIMRLARLNPVARMILLSATLGNAATVAAWVKKLNGKETRCFRSSWRPTEIEIRGWVVDDEQEARIAEAVRLASETTEKTIVFVHSKRVGAEITARLKKAGVLCGFHNASVSRSGRRKIEQQFDDAFSGMNVIVSTSTLGAGVNIG